jgi:hypothetical protein
MVVDVFSAFCKIDCLTVEYAVGGRSATLLIEVIEESFPRNGAGVLLGTDLVGKAEGRGLLDFFKLVASESAARALSDTVDRLGGLGSGFRPFLGSIPKVLGKGTPSLYVGIIKVPQNFAFTLQV